MESLEGLGIVGIPNRELSEEELERLSDVIMEFSQVQTGISLYDYEYEFGWRIVYSILVEDADEITALFSRQSGKTETVAVVVCGCMVILPILGKELGSDERLAKFAGGFWCGIYAPNYDLAGILWSRMKARMYGISSRGILKDPEIGIDLRGELENMVLPNGSFCDCGTASPHAKIEGKTYHLVMLEECLGGESEVVTPRGEVTIQSLVEIGYRGKVLGFDHVSGEEVWSEVLGDLERLAQKECYLLRFSNGVEVRSTGKHPWYLSGEGYIETKELYRRVVELGEELEFRGLVSEETRVYCEYMEIIPPVERVYDLKTSTGNFFAGGVLSHNCQDISSNKIRSSIHPMCASTAGTLVKIGTPSPVKSDFYESCRRNKRHDVSKGLLRDRKRSHFEFDYTVAQRVNARYRKYVEKERSRLGEDSDDFRMKYRLHWILERGMFVSSDIFDECGISKVDVLKERIGKGLKKREISFRRPSGLTTYDNWSDGQVAAIDIGRKNSTVITIGKVWWDNPIDYGGGSRYYLHVVNWYELYGDDHESQHPQMLTFLKNYRLGSVVVDATGKGDPIYSRLKSDLEQFGIVVIPFIFSAESKDRGYKVFLQEIRSKRFSYPSSKGASKRKVWQRFYSQMVDLEKSWSGGRMVVSKPKGDRKEARDDFCDSAMMLCWLVNVEGSYEVEVGPNPLIGRAAKWASAEMMGKAGAWFRSAVNPRGSIPAVRESKRGKW